MERVIKGLNALTAVFVVASFVALYGFHEPLLPRHFLYGVQVALLCILIIASAARSLNAASKAEYWRANWFEIPLIVGLAISLLGAGRWFGRFDAASVRHFAVGVYLVLQVLAKLCRTTVNLAASGKNPTRTLIVSFLVLIVSGAGLLMLPKASAGEKTGFVDALFTATSATCVTGLIVKDTGSDFSLMGQVVILSLIQLGGLGIVVFGAVFALLLGQALSLRESVAMQDLLSTRTLSRIGNMIAFVFIGTVLIEAVGAVTLFGMWDDVPGWTGNVHRQWFCSVFHSISAFCNAGFSLFSNSFISYGRCWQIYLMVCPLIVLGGLGFGVLYNLANIIADRVNRFFKKLFNKQYRIAMEAPKKMRLQTKIALSISALLIVMGALCILVFEHYTGKGDPSRDFDVLGAFFQSITARTAGFNTVDIRALSDSSKFILILLMFIGGSPGSTAGGIKTVTLAVIVMTVFAALRKRSEVEMFKRSVRIVVVGRAITVTMLFVVVLFGATLALSITESDNPNGFAMSDIMFEAGSALGTVGLTTGLTPFLTAGGKLIIIAVMLVGRLGPLTLLAALTFNLKPARYNYPDEAIIVG
ncbi:MAG: Trk family potassium uptake protein [Phycisphaerales bacterium]|nr:MAG: Trk family potassium uptake protein [Phycisphaerales bacterium]